MASARHDVELTSHGAIPGGHFDAYESGFDASVEPARDWFTRHLSA